MLRLADLLRSLVGGGPREAGPLRSRTGASSFHLIWEMPAGSGSRVCLTEVSAVLEVVVPPRERALYFWALQVDFLHGDRILGGGHTGLQWNKRYPAGTAVNWGGYASADLGGQVLAGTASALDGFPDDPNTLAYAWEAGHPYRLRVHRSPEIPGGWRAEVTDLGTGLATVIRDLLPEPAGEKSECFLTRPLVWSEVFADCDAPSVTVRWSDLRAVDEAGEIVRPKAVRVNYQSPKEGGCSNTNVLTDERGGFLQVTNTSRLVAQGARLPLPRLA